MDADSDRELLTAWSAGDEEAFAGLVARYHRLVRAACRRQAAPGDEDDCVQAVFLVLSRRPRAALHAPALAAWLQRVAVFVCRRSRRAAWRRSRAERAAAAEAATGGHGATVAPEASASLDECLLRLPERQRIAVSMRHLGGASPEEVAAALGTTVANAGQILHRGMDALRSAFARRGVQITPAALIGILVAEARAGTDATVSIARITAVPPSSGATALANGAITAMRIHASILPAAIAVPALALIAASVAVTAEGAAPPAQAAPASAVVAGPETWTWQEREIAWAMKQQLFAAQVMVQAGMLGGRIDKDGNGVGEYATVDELVQRSGPLCVIGEDRSMYGYRVRVHLPDGHGAPAGAGDPHPAGAAQEQQMFWIAYAWPIDPRSGSRAFAIRMDGQVQAKVWTGGEPAWNSAYAGWIGKPLWAPVPAGLAASAGRGMVIDMPVRNGDAGPVSPGPAKF